MENMVMENEETIKDNYPQIEKLRNDIEKMAKTNHIEILRILKKGKTQINENKNGIFINMTELTNDALNEIQKYVEYVLNQHSHLDEQEEEKEKFHKTFFKDNKETTSTTLNNE
tara:strand:- start:7534 stop:7875 length:342 start_codon:yes stop_codon:yes gene_type:complete